MATAGFPQSISCYQELPNVANVLQVFCWGNGGKGQLGNGKFDMSYIPCKAGTAVLHGLIMLINVEALRALTVLALPRKRVIQNVRPAWQGVGNIGEQ